MIEGIKGYGWANHFFHEHNNEADAWARKGVKGRVGEWVDTANVVWSEVTGLCGFQDGSRENGTFGAGILIQAFTRTLGWAPVHTKSGPVRGRNSLDAELVSTFSFNMWQIVHYIDIDICTLTPSLPCRCLPCLFFFFSLSTDRYSSVVQYSS